MPHTPWNKDVQNLERQFVCGQRGQKEIPFAISSNEEAAPCLSETIRHACGHWVMIRRADGRFEKTEGIDELPPPSMRCAKEKVSR